MKTVERYCTLTIVLISLSFAGNISATPKSEWVDIVLTDMVKYVEFGVSKTYNSKYPPSNLFDARFNTCWVAGSGINGSSLYLKLPILDGIVLNIFSGYGKSDSLFHQNARPSKLRVTVYGVVNPEGYVSETSVMYKAVKFPGEQIIHLEDRFGIQSVPLSFSPKKLRDFTGKVSRLFDAEFKTPKASSGLVARIEMLEVYPGSKYTDVCISELFFNDRFVTPTSANVVTRVFLNRDENALLLNDNLGKNIEVFRDPSLIFQIIDVSKNKKWAVLIAMPAEIDGRAETTYLLVDLINRKVVNRRLEQATGNYLDGNEMYFETKTKGKLYLVYNAKDGEYHKLELR